MPTGTIVMRPSQDVSVGHAISSGNEAYLMISDVVADDDSTYIKLELPDNATHRTVEASSVFILSGDIPQHKFKVDGVRLCARVRIGENDEYGFYRCYFAIGTTGGSDNSMSVSAEPTASYETQSATSQNLVDAINAELELGHFPDMSVTVYTSGHASEDGKVVDGEICVTQVYMEIDYTEKEIIYIKENGQWSRYSKVFKKENDKWIEQTDFINLFDENINYKKEEGGAS